MAALGAPATGFDALCAAINAARPAAERDADYAYVRRRDAIALYAKRVTADMDARTRALLTRDMGMLVAGIEVPPEQGVVVIAASARAVASAESAKMSAAATAITAWLPTPLPAGEAVDTTALDAYRRRAQLPPTFDAAALGKQLVLNALGVPITHPAMRRVSARAQQQLPALTTEERALACALVRRMRFTAGAPAADCPWAVAAARARGQNALTPADAVCVAIDAAAHLSAWELRRYQPPPPGTIDENLVNAIAGP